MCPCIVAIKQLLSLNTRFRNLCPSSVLELEWNPLSARSGNSSTARESRGTKSKFLQLRHSLPLHSSCVILCHCTHSLPLHSSHSTLAAALYFEQSSCDELMEFKQIQTRAQPEESLKHKHRQVWLCFNDSSGCALV